MSAFPRLTSPHSCPSTLPSPPPLSWHHTAVIYHIYPSSFSCPPGSPTPHTGSIRGIINKIPYLKSLGINAIWLGACHLSSGIDNGYDVVDYRQVDPQFGTVQDLEELIAKLKNVGIGVIMDIVVNHTSWEHAWFKESRRSEGKEGKGEWYFWRKSSSEKTVKKISDDGSEVQEVIRLPPNNWASIFGGSAWKYDEMRKEWFLHIFSEGQPDLNWNCEDVRRAIYEEMRFWVGKGVVGFRLDVVNLISKMEDLERWNVREAGEREEDVDMSDPKPAYEFYCSGEKVHRFLREMRREVFGVTGQRDGDEDLVKDEKSKILLGEVIVTSDPDAVRSYMLPERKELDMLYQYDIFDLDSLQADGKFSSPDPPLTQKQLMHMLKKTITHWQVELGYQRTGGGSGTIWLESHDTARSVSRFGGDTLNSSEEYRRKYRFKVAKMLALLECTLGGTLFIYQGQEIGMINLRHDVDISEYQDVETKKAREVEYEKRKRDAIAAAQCHLKQARTNDLDIDMSDFEAQLRLKARDHARMPLPWVAASENEPHAGFSSASKETKMWSPMNTDSKECNVAKQQNDPDSVLSFWRELIRFRRERVQTVVIGDFEAVKTTVGDELVPVFAYWRRGSSKKVVNGSEDDGSSWDLLVVINMTADEDVQFALPRVDICSGYNGQDARGKDTMFDVVMRTNEVSGLGNAQFKSGHKIDLGAFEGMVFACRR
ncbi:Trehalose-6-phosphate hydrolase [Cercospora zeina]